jgi:uncharacterized protein YpuA (DUF1002 family)
MELITESQIKEILNKILNEGSPKVSRIDYNRVQFKIDELMSSLSETQKELRKLQDSIPAPLKKITERKIGEVSASLSNSYRAINDMKAKLQQVKKSSYSQPLSIEEKKKD